MNTQPFNSSIIDQKTVADLRGTESRKWNTFDSDVIGAFVAEMDLGTADVIQNAMRSMIKQEAYGYLPHRFAAELSESCANWLHSTFSWTVEPEHVFPIGDVLEALEQTIRNFSSPISPIIVPTPAYMPFLSMPQTLNREVIQVPMVWNSQNNRFQLDLVGISNAFEQGGELFILCNPHNPIGRVYDKNELKSLADVVDRFDGIVFSDEIHSPLVYSGNEHVPYASISDISASHTITATSASKAWNIPGVKCAEVIISDDALRDKWERVAGKTVFGASNFGVVASIAAFNDGEEWLSHALQYLDRNRNFMSDFLVSNCPSIKFTPPEATYLAWLDFRELGLGDSPRVPILEHAKVATSDGPTFGEAGRGFLRFNFAMPFPLLEDALRRIRSFAEDTN